MSCAEPQRKNAELRDGSQEPVFHRQHDVYVACGLRDGDGPQSTFLLADICERRQQNWAEGTEHLCWHCCHSFRDSPIGIPTEHGHQRYTLRGNFCSLECAKGFVTQESRYNSHVHIALLERMARDIYKRTDPIVPAPNRFCLKAFGGVMDLNEFRACRHATILHEPPFVSQRMVMEVKRAQSASTVSVDHASVRGLRCPAKPLDAETVLAPQTQAHEPMYSNFLSKSQNNAKANSNGSGSIGAFLK
jgi:hypothetical protein